jgi:hypothetical protein
MSQYSINEEAEKIVGKRELGDAIVLDDPGELDYKCPVGKDHILQWSEYRGFLWCHTCGLDIPTCLCVPNLHRVEELKKATQIYLACVKDVVTKWLI